MILYDYDYNYLYAVHFINQLLLLVIYSKWNKDKNQTTNSIFKALLSSSSSISYVQIDALPPLFVLTNNVWVMRTYVMVPNVTADKRVMLSAFLKNLWSSSKTESRVKRDKYLVKYKEYLTMYLTIMTLWSKNYLKIGNGS